MNRTQAVRQVLKDADRTNKVLSTSEIRFLADKLCTESKQLSKKRNEYNVLSAKNAGSRVMRPITTLNQLTIPVLRDMSVSTASEFLGEELWLSLRNMNEKIVAVRVYNEIRARLTRGMC